MLHDVYLYGGIAEKYGAHHRFDISTAPEAARALAANFKDFYQDFKDGFYQVIIGDREKGTQIDQSMGRLKIGKDKPIHIIPVVGGSKGGGGIKIVAGLALMAPFMWEFLPAVFAAGGAIDAAAACGTSVGAEIIGAAGTAAATSFSVGGFSVSYGALASMGLSLVLGGVSQVLSRAPSVSTQSFLFNGALNSTRQGTAIPVVYGEIETGSILVSAGMQVVQLL